MTKPLSAKRTFNQEDRQWLRNTLVQYSKEHRIGVPTLQIRIAEAAGREPHLLPLKTLQRFLAGKSRTNDAMLALCFRFAETINAKTGPEQFSEAAAAFYDVASVSSEADRANLLGSWDGLALALGGMTVVIKGEDASSVPASRLRFRAMGSGGGIKTIETITNPKRDLSAKYDEGMQHIYEGVALRFQRLLCVFSKNLLTRLPRTYWLQESAAGELIGHGIEATFGASAWPRSDPEPFRFSRSAEEANDDQ